MAYALFEVNDFVVFERLVPNGAYVLDEGVGHGADFGDGG